MNRHASVKKNLTKAHWVLGPSWNRGCCEAGEVSAQVASSLVEEPTNKQNQKTHQKNQISIPGLMSWGHGLCELMCWDSLRNKNSEKWRRKRSVWLERPGGQGGFVEQVELQWALKEDRDRTVWDQGQEHFWRTQKPRLKPGHRKKSRLKG